MLLLSAFLEHPSRLGVNVKPKAMFAGSNDPASPSHAGRAQHKSWVKFRYALAFFSAKTFAFAATILQKLEVSLLPRLCTGHSVWHAKMTKSYFAHVRI